MHKLPNVIKNRHGTYYLRTWHHGKESKVSLRTKDWAKAKLLASCFHIKRSAMDLDRIRKLGLRLPNGSALDIKTQDDVDLARELLGQEFFDSLTRSNGAGLPPEGVGTTNSVPTTYKTKPFSEAVALYLNQKQLENVAKTLKEKKKTYEGFQRLFGDPDTNAISKEMAISYKNKLIGDKLSALRINKTLSFMRDFFVYCMDHGYYTQANPFLGLDIGKGKNKKEGNSAIQPVKHYEPFSSEELKRIFEDPRYKTFMNKPDYYWLPFLALYTGARIEELASLEMKNIRSIDAVHCFIIEKGKTNNSIRKIPLHREIILSKFTDYLEEARKAQHVMLFPHLKSGANGFSKNCSRRFGQYLDLIGIKEKQKTFHSFRSTFINQLTNTNTSPTIIMGIVGHYDQAKIDFSSPHFTSYQPGSKPIEVLKDAVNRVQYPIEVDF